MGKYRIKAHIGKKVICALLIFVFLSGFENKALAVDPSIAIVGQAVMDQALFSNITAIGADACGMTYAINQTKSPAQSIANFLKSEWDNYLLRQQLTWGTALAVASNGVRYLKDGSLIFNGEFSDLLSGYLNWIWSGDNGPNVSQNAEVIEGEGGEGSVLPPLDMTSNTLYYPNYNYYVNVGQSVTFNHSFYGDSLMSFRLTNNSGYVFWLKNANSESAVMCLSLVSDSVQYLRDGSLIQTYSMSTGHMKDGNIFYYISSIVYDSGRTNEQGAITYLTNNNGNRVTADTQAISDIAYILFNGRLDIGGDDILVGNPGALSGLNDLQNNVLSPQDRMGLNDLLPAGAVTGTVDVVDYIGGVTEGIENGQGDINITVTDEQGIESEEVGEFTYDNTADIENEIVNEEALVEDGVITDVAPVTEVEDLQDFVIDLRNYFPFCIPFDLYDMMNAFTASPEAPVFHWRFYIPNIADEDIEIDLSAFDSVAQVLRSCELVAAAIGLAILTKQIIQGGD